jgi:hypothetical protein
VSSPHVVAHDFDEEAHQAEREGKFTTTEVEIMFLVTIFGVLMWVCAAWIFAI